MKKSIILAVSVMALTSTMYGESDVVAVSELPEHIRNAATQNFGGRKIATAHVDTSFFGMIVDKYRISYTDGYKVELDPSGKWTKIDASASASKSGSSAENIKKGDF